MPTPIRQLESLTSYPADGVTTVWDFSFSGGYLDQAHVKAYTLAPTGARTEITVTPAMFLGEFQLEITPPVADGAELTIYRQTPTAAPLVDFTDRAAFTESDLDTSVKQSIFAAAETVDSLSIATERLEDVATYAQAAEDAKVAAQSSQTAAAASESAAATSAANAANSASAASTSASEAAASAAAAIGSVNSQTFSGDGVATAFALASAPGGKDNTQVYISGVYQQKSEYNVAGTSLTFNVAPPTGASNVEVVTVSSRDIGTTGAESVSFTPAGSGAVATNVQDQLRGLAVRPENYGAAGDGTTDDASKLALALATGKLVYLDPTKTYAFGTQLTPPSNGGFIGGGTLKMLTSAGKFDAAAYGTAYAANITGVLIDGKTNTRIEAKFDMEANAGIRVCHPLAVRSSTNVKVIGEATGFKEAQHGLLAWDSNVGGYVRWYAHDITPDSTTLGSMQITGFEVDNNRVASVNSTGLIFEATAKNVRLGASARATYGEQSDAMNIQSQGYSGAVGRVTAEDVGEALDVFGDNCVIEVAAKNCYAYGVKLIHGASHNNITAAIDGTVGHALVYGGSNTSTKSVEHNSVRLTASRVGELTGGAAISNPSAVATDGPSATYKPQYNRTEVVAKGNGAAMSYVVFEESGTGNTYDADGIGWSTQFGFIAGTAGTGNIIRRKRSTHIRAYIGTATTVSNGAVVAYDTESWDVTGEFDPATGTATVRCTGRYKVKAQVRAGSVSTLANFGLQIQKNGGEICRNTPINPAASSQEMYASIEAVVDCDAGDTLRVACVTSEAGSVGVTNQSAYSFLEIEQV